MLYRKDDQWALCPYKVKYVQNEEELEAYTHDKQWWLNFAEKWDHTEILEFQDAEYTEEQLARLEEIRHYNKALMDECRAYAEEGTFPEGLEHPLRALQLQKENERLGVELSEREINEIIQGMQISEIEIELLELKMGGM
ncbi:MAG: hypothetical protein JJT76_12790 [Clostridiaceae bacterium]|nr:hypothetical protein [Clostridiaceae bacterium]